VMNESIMRARFFFFTGLGVFLGPMEDALDHRHHAVQLVLGLDGAFEVWAGTVKHDGLAAIIAPNHPHRFKGKGRRHAVLLLDPELSAYASIIGAMGKESGVTMLDPSPVERELQGFLSSLHSPPECTIVKDLCEKTFRRLSRAGLEETPDTDARISAAKSFISRAPDRKAPIAVVAREVGLSEGRLIHLFKEHTGIPIRRYILWLRLIEAVERAMGSVSLTVAAHDAGFSDSAHLSRTFKRMFGITPSFLFKNSQFIQVISCLD
jgi:AraC-like DNA-binding protein